MKPQHNKSGANRRYIIDRLFVLRSVFVVIGMVYIVRLFYVQILNQSHYKALARSEQFKQLQVESERGSIYMRSAGDVVALAVNESRFTIIADPTYVKDANTAAKTLSPILNVPEDQLLEKLKKKTHYAVLQKKVDKEAKKKVEDAKLKGIAWKEERQRTYPQGSTAANVLGFVNDEGDGQYGVEGSLNNLLKGRPGVIKAITDVQGIPLAQNKDNIVTNPVDGENIVLTIDQTIQRVTEEHLKEGVEKTGAKSGTVIVLEADTGRVAAMADYPTYNPAQYTKVEDATVFKNRVVSDPLEVGSIMKVMTVASALDSGSINSNWTYQDPGYVVVDGMRIGNVVDLGSGTRTLEDVLKYSLNTGAVHILEQLGGGNLDEVTRTKWHSYLADHYLLTQASSIEQEEATIGVVPDPLEGDGLRIQYANTSFGQGISMTLQQYASAFSAIINGGTYYQPTVVYGVKTIDGVKEQQPKVVKSNIVSSDTTNVILDLLRQYADYSLVPAKREGFIVGGKSGTAQVPDFQKGGYRTDVLNATYAGYVGRTKPKYVVVLRLDEGTWDGLSFSGGYSAKPVFIDILNSIMDNIPISDN